MNQERMFQIIKVPHISEKSALLGDSANQAVFQVASDARKSEIKEAVEQLFNVKVANVRTANMKGKTICVLSDSCGAPVTSGITRFRGEFEALIKGKRSSTVAVGA